MAKIKMEASGFAVADTAGAVPRGHGATRTSLQCRARNDRAPLRATRAASAIQCAFGHGRGAPCERCLLNRFAQLAYEDRGPCISESGKISQPLLSLARPPRFAPHLVNEMGFGSQERDADIKRSGYFRRGESRFHVESRSSWLAQAAGASWRLRIRKMCMFIEARRNAGVFG